MRSKTSWETGRTTLVARLLGFRVVERSSDHLVIRVPPWISREGIRRVVDRLREEQPLYDGTPRGMRIRTAGRLNPRRPRRPTLP